MTAAVADFSPESISNKKIKKEDFESNGYTLKLKKTKDILEALGKQKRINQMLIGFALETNDEIKNAQIKLLQKKLNLIVLNNPLKKGAGFGSDTNIVTLIQNNGKKEKLPLMAKYNIAEKLLDHAATFLKNRNRK
jgi:phosphopantothenoylcysteine decarboxylase/phosphopantothenate--cysteine ligase